MKILRVLFVVSVACSMEMYISCCSTTLRNNDTSGALLITTPTVLLLVVHENKFLAQNVDGRLKLPSAECGEGGTYDEVAQNIAYYIPAINVKKIGDSYNFLFYGAQYSPTLSWKDYFSTESSRLQKKGLQAVDKDQISQVFDIDSDAAQVMVQMFDEYQDSLKKQ